MAGLWLGQAFGVFLLPGFGVGSSSPQVPRHPTSMCDAGVKWRIGALDIQRLPPLPANL